MLRSEETVLIVVDVQGKLAQLMYEREPLFAGLTKIVRGARVLGLPVIWLEQNPAGLGPTVPELAAEMPPGLSPIPKFSFSCWGEPRFRQALDAGGRRTVLLCGIEAHICIWQTACDLVAGGRAVEVVADAVSSRRVLDREIGLRRAAEVGARLTTVETALFEMMARADDPRFRELVRIVK